MCVIICQLSWQYIFLQAWPMLFFSCALLHENTRKQQQQPGIESGHQALDLMITRLVHRSVGFYFFCPYICTISFDYVFFHYRLITFRYMWPNFGKPVLMSHWNIWNCTIYCDISKTVTELSKHFTLFSGN